MQEYKNLYILDTVFDELRREVFGRRGNADAKRYAEWFARCAQMLDIELEKAVLFPQFEKISGSENLYSMRYPKSKKNPRVLYFFLCNGVPVLLYAFLEKNKSDYTHGIEVAEERAKFVNDNWPGLEVLE